MRKFGALLALVSLLGLLGGCATTGGFPSDPKDQALWYVERAAKQAEQGDFERVSFMLTEAVSRPGGVEAAKDFLVKSPSVNTRLADYLQQTSKNSINKEELNNLARYSSALGKSGVIKDAEQLTKSIEANVARKNSNQRGQAHNKKDGNYQQCGIPWNEYLQPGVNSGIAMKRMGPGLSLVHVTI